MVGPILRRIARRNSLLPMLNTSGRNPYRRIRRFRRLRMHAIIPQHPLRFLESRTGVFLMRIDIFTMVLQASYFERLKELFR